MIKHILTVFLLTIVFNIQSQGFWTKKEETRIQLRSDDMRTVIPEKYQVFNLDLVALKQYLANAPKEDQPDGIELDIPMPDGTMERFEVFEAPSMQEGLAAMYPSIKSYKAYSKTSKLKSVRFAVGPNGFYAAINAWDGEKYIDPYSEKNIDDYIVYDLKDHKYDIYKDIPMCGVNDEIRPTSQHFKPISNRNTGIVDLRVFKIAIACTGEWGSVARRGTVEKCLADMNVMLTRMNAIYEKEMAMRFVMIDDNDKIIFLNAATDPYTTGGGRVILPLNTGVINTRISGGQSAYDIGHVLHICTDIGGVAQGGSACQSNKANGVTCNNDNDLTTIVTRVMAHEVGHQFDASHTWNICQPDDPLVDNQRAPNFAYEPGSGSTIMSYAGTCPGDNVLGDNDDYFHVASLEQMYNKTYSGGNAAFCSDKVPTNNHFPVVSVPAQRYTIPISTPFELRGSATDEDGDVLTYCWEQFDLGPKVALGTNGDKGPLFRSFKPSTTGDVRFIPRPADILTGVNNKNEVLPNVSRDLNFRLTIRDNNSEAGGVVWGDYAIDVSDQAGPFKITFPELDAKFKVGDEVNVTWNVANTDKAPVNCKRVNIYGSFSSALRNDDPNLIPLALNVPNDGSHIVYIPNKISNLFRIVIKAADNIFLTSSIKVSRIDPPPAPTVYVEANQPYLTVCQPDAGVVNFSTLGLAGFTGDVTFEVESGLPAGAEASFDNPTITAGSGNSLTFTTNNIVGSQSGELVVKISGNGMETIRRVIGFQIEGGNLSDVITLSPANGQSGVSGLPKFNWNKKTDATSYEFQLATSPDFSAGNIVSQNVTIDSITNISSLLEKTEIYYWRVRANNNCRQGEWSDISAFITEALSCKEFKSGVQAIVISTSGTPTVELPLTINESGIISDLNIKLIRAEHARTGDLVPYLVAPSGKEALLWNRQCSSQQNVNVGLDDQAPDFFQCPINTGKLYRTATNNPTVPAQKLEIFNGEQMNGTWKLRVEDKQAGSGGRLQELNLEICANITVSNPFIVKNETLIIAPKDKTFITNAFLLAGDNDQTADQLMYTLVKVPSKGSLTFNGNVINAGARFSQVDINSSKLRYESVSTTDDTDDFNFIVDDGNGGWTGILSFNILVDSKLSSVSDYNISQDIFLYPNPTGANINVNLTGNASSLNSYYLSDISGRVIFQGELKPGGSEIIIDAISSGVYFITFTDGKKTVSKKLVKL